jgi:hypothetical protein
VKQLGPVHDSDVGVDGGRNWVSCGVKQSKREGAPQWLECGLGVD